MNSRIVPERRRAKRRTTNGWNVPLWAVPLAGVLVIAAIGLTFAITSGAPPRATATRHTAISIGSQNFGTLSVSNDGTAVATVQSRGALVRLVVWWCVPGVGHQHKFCTSAVQHGGGSVTARVTLYLGPGCLAALAQTSAGDNRVATARLSWPIGPRGRTACPF
jgi:hypothetical protein